MTDSEREIMIKAAGGLMLQAHEEGNQGAAKAWLEAQSKLIKERSPAQGAHMESCYFCERGEADRKLSKGIEA
ncbi:MAG: hypothetical protein HXX19_11265 [Rhodoferax sp.]|nr:hypothetical protein [Rhodoferax sp.]